MAAPWCPQLPGGSWSLLPSPTQSRSLGTANGGCFVPLCLCLSLSDALSTPGTLGKGHRQPRAPRLLQWRVRCHTAPPGRGPTAQGQRVDWRQDAARPGLLTTAHQTPFWALLSLPLRGSVPHCLRGEGGERGTRVCQRWRRHRGCQTTVGPPPSPGCSAAPGGGGMGDVISSGCGFCCVWGQRGQRPSWSQSAARWGGDGDVIPEPVG